MGQHITTVCLLHYIFNYGLLDIVGIISVHINIVSSYMGVSQTLLRPTIFG